MVLWCQILQYVLPVWCNGVPTVEAPTLQDKVIILPVIVDL